MITNVCIFVCMYVCVCLCVYVCVCLGTCLGVHACECKQAVSENMQNQTAQQRMFSNNYILGENPCYFSFFQRNIARILLPTENTTNV